MKALKRLLGLFLSATITFSAATSALLDVYGAEISLTVNPWYEGAVATWADTGASGYTVSYKQASQSDNAYTQVDTELIRGTRADILGLRANTTYNIKVEDTSGNTQVETVKTAEYDRSGFAHFGYSAVGAYNNDGTPKDNAAIIYVNNSNKNTVAYKNYTGIADICKNKSNISEPLIIRIIGTVDTQQRTETGFSGNTDKINNLTDKPSSDGYVNMLDTKNAKNLTIEGVGSDAEIKYWGMMFDTAESIEIRNLTYTGFPEDATSFNYSKRIWLHNNKFNPGSVLYDFSADQDKEAGDGASDFSKSNENVTIAYNHYAGCYKTCLVSGSKTSNNDHFTIHHNFFDMVHQRCPFTRNTDFHYYNNYIYKCITGVNGGVGTWMFAEANYFEDTPTSDISDSKVNQKELGALFCKEGGVIKGYNNVYDKCSTTKETVVKTRTEAVSSSNDFANFDTDTSLFYYDSVNKVSDVMHLTSGQQAKEDVLKYTGTMKSEVAPLYVNKPTIYETGNPSTETTTEITTKAATEATTEITTKATTEVTTKAATEASTEATTAPQPVGDKVEHSFNGGKDSSFFTISGNLSTSYGNVNYNGENIPQCLKMESSTSIGFSGNYTKLTLVFRANEAGNTIKVDGTAYSIPTDGILTVDITDGAHTITKGKGSSYLFYMSCSGGTTDTTAETSTEQTTTLTTTVTTTEATTETTTEATTNITAETTTETTTNTPQETNVVNLELGEAVTGFESDTAGDTGSGISVTYDNATDTWSLKDTSSTAAAALTVPFAQQTKGKVVISGSATPSSSSSKWALVMIKGVDSAGNAEKEILSLATDGSKVLSVRTVDASGTQVNTPIGGTLTANATYDFKIVLDLDNQTAIVTSGGKTVSVDINAKAVDGVYTTTSKKSSRNISISNLKVGLVTDGYVYGDANGNGTVEITDAIQLLQKINNNTKVGLEEKTTDYMTYIDVDSDGKLTSADVAHIMRKIMNSDYVLPV